MATFKVNVNKLNLRSGPVKDFDNKENVVGVLHKDAVFESVREIQNELGTWQVNADGHCVSEKWLGDTNVITPLINYNTLIQDIPDEWRKTKGQNIIIAVIDTGCFAHPALKDSILKQYNVFDENSLMADDESGHGTFISGLIASKNNSNISGIAQDVKLLVIKVAKTGDNDVVEDNVYKGLNWLATKCEVVPNLINISLDFPVEKFKAEFDSIFKAFVAKGVMILSAAKNDEGLLGSINYPASNDHVIAVGALSPQSVVVTNGNVSKINKKVKYIIPNISFTSLDVIQFGTVVNSGCSFSTAVTTGILSLALAYSKSKNIQSSFFDFFDDSISALNSNSFTNNLKIFKI